MTWNFRLDCFLFLFLFLTLLFLMLLFRLFLDFRPAGYFYYIVVRTTIIWDERQRAVCAIEMWKLGRWWKRKEMENPPFLLQVNCNRFILKISLPIKAFFPKRIELEFSIRKRGASCSAKNRFHRIKVIGKLGNGIGFRKERFDKERTVG